MDDKLASLLKPEAPVEIVDAGDEAAVVEEAKPDAPSNFISTAQSQAIKSFFDGRILSQFALYKTALYERNPSNVSFAEFKEVCLVSLL